MEQILGRILWLPHTTQHSRPALNMSYVLTSSNDFDQTVKQIIKGLNSAGFSDKDYRLSNPVAPKEPEPTPEQLKIPQPSPEGSSDAEEFLDFDPQAVVQELERRQTEADPAEAAIKGSVMLEQAERAGQEYNATVSQTAGAPYMQDFAWEVREQVTTFKPLPRFYCDDAKREDHPGGAKR